MQRIILRHMSGSKARQVEEFPINLYKELVFGRDPSATVKYDPTQDDLVGRQHAKVVQDPSDPAQFYIVDLNSRNGTFLNKQKIVGTSRIAPGDTVQFGAGGPEFQFDIDPRPQQSYATRPPAQGGTADYGSQHSAPPATRVGGPLPSAPGPVHAAAPPHTAGSPPGPTAAAGGVGKATVERMIAKQKSDTTKYLIIGGAALMVVILLIAGVVVYMSSQNQMPANLTNASANTPMTPADIVKNFTNSVVYFEVGWKLIYTPTGGQVYHLYIPNNFQNSPIVSNGEPAVAGFISVGDNRFEPYLTLDSRQGRPVGGEHTGSGFTVTSDGFILTNRHVAATWRTSYLFPRDAQYGVVIQNGRLVVGNDGRPIVIRAPNDWVPSETKQAGQQLQGGFEGRNDYLNVTFAKNDLRIPAKLARVSDRHDVAMVKVDIPEAVSKVELFDNYAEIKPGDGAIVLGYPAISPPVYGVTRSQDVFNRESKLKIVPDPTVSVGNVGRLLRSKDDDDSKDPVYSAFGDAYQLTINSTGAGNSGGPVFDDRGRVIGIFFAGARGDASITFAVPIRYGKELMGVGPSK